MKFITTGRVGGAIGCLALLCCFVAPPFIDLANGTCAPPLACPASVERGVREVLALAVLYCVVAGLLISRVLDREPATRGGQAAIMFFLALMLAAVPLWLMLRVAF